MDRSPQNQAPEAFIDLIDDVLRRADERAVGGGRSNFHSETLAEFAGTLTIAMAAVWRVTQSDADCLSQIGTLGEDATRQILQQLPLHEIRKQTTGTSHVWFAREVLDERSSIVLGIEVPERLRFGEFEEVLASLVRLHADVERRNRLGQLNRVIERQNQLLNLIARLHESSRLDQLCSVLASDGAAVLDVDRISVCAIDAAKARLVAATGIVDPEERANSTRSLVTLAEHCVNSNRDLDWSESNTDQPKPVAQCLSESKSSLIRAMRVATSVGTRAVVVFEQFHSARPTTDNAAGVVHQFATALENLERNESGLSIGRIRSSLRGRRGVIATVIAASLLALAFFPAKFEVEAYGVIQPTQRRDLFAPEAGLVESVDVQDSQSVGEGSRLLQLRNAELAIKYEKYRGDLETTKSQLAAVTASPAAIDPQTGLSSAAITRELQQRIASLQKQIKLVSQQMESLRVVAPFNGVVFFGDLSRSLERRTVQQGQFLLQFADTSGDWELLLKIPDTLSRHVLKARDENQEVTFLLRLAPGKTFKAKLDWVGLATELDATGQLSTPARVSLDDSFFQEVKREDLRPGSGVIARIDCGSRSIGYVWFHEAIDAVRRRLVL